MHRIMIHRTLSCCTQFIILRFGARRMHSALRLLDFRGKRRAAGGRRDQPFPPAEASPGALLSELFGLVYFERSGKQFAIVLLA